MLADRARWSIAGIEIILGAAAVFGGYSLLSDADALGAKQEWLDGSLFPDYTIPGLFLLVVIAAGSLLSASVTALAPRYASLTAGALAAVLAAWGIVETATVGWHGWPQLVLLSAFVAGPALALGVFSARRLRRCPRVEAGLDGHRSG